MNFISFDRSLELLRYALGVVFVWFGILKLFNSSPVLPLIKEAAPAMLANSGFFLFSLAVLEILLGISFFMKRLVGLGATVTAGYLLLVTLATLLAKGFNPWFPVLSFEGEFVIKNLVLMAACLVLLSDKESSSKITKTAVQLEQNKEGKE